MSQGVDTLLDVSETISAEELVAEVVRQAERENAPESICLTSSFQTEDMVVLHMLREHLPRVPVIFLETGYHFPELIAYRDRMVVEWDLNLVNALPKTTLGRAREGVWVAAYCGADEVLRDSQGGTVDAFAGAIFVVVYGIAAGAVAYPGGVEEG